ncbi:MAG: putative Ig domain-containing protein, partial [Acidimicrobiia bacterium]
SDPDGDDLTWSATGLPAGLSIDSGTGTISGTLSYTSAGTHAVLVRATDDDAAPLFTEVVLAWTVSNTNRAPTVPNPGDQSGAENDSISLAISGSDPDGDDLTWSATGLPGGLSIDSGTGTISGTLSYASAGTHAVLVRATDDDAAPLFTEVVLAWTVSNTNRAPAVTSPGARFSAENEVVSLAVSGSDPDGDDLTWSATGLPAGLSIDSGTGTISGTLSYTSDGTHAVLVRATDDDAAPLASEVAFTWTVSNTNQAPTVINPADQASVKGDSISLPVSGSDPDDDTLTWAAAGLPAGATISTVTGTIAGAPSVAGAFTVTVTATDNGSPNLSADATFTWTVEAPPGFPTIEAIGNQHTLVGDSVSLRPDWSHPDALSMTWSAVGLPTGLDINRATGEINGRTAAAGVFSVTVTLTDSRDQAVEASFLWSVAIPDLPPIATADRVRIEADAIGSGIVVDVLGNDSDPEGSAISLLSMEQPEFGTAAIVNGLVFFTPLQGWIGTVEFLYTVVDETGNQATGLLTITIEESLGMVLATAALEWEPATPPSVSFDEIGLNIGAGTVFVLGSVVQSLYVLGFPLALFGGAVFWSLIFGGLLNVGFAVKGGIPMIVRRTPRNAAVVMVAHGKKLQALSKPGKGELVCEYLATDRGLQATGRRSKNFDRRWAEIETPDGPAWVPAVFLAEQVDRVGFANDPMPINLIEELVVRMRARAPISDLVSKHGLWVAHHGPIERYRRYELDSLMDDQSIRTWPGRNPAFPAFRGTFDIAVATSFLDAWEHPQRQLLRDQRAVPSTMVPVEFTNFHTVSIGADVSGRERLDLPAWLVVFAYEDDRARIIGLVKEG